MKRLKEFLRSTNVKRVGENILSLSVLNGINYIFPLVLIPFLTRTLGVENYGKYAFAYAVLNYFTLITRYGFEFSATKHTAVIRDSKEELNRLFTSVYLVRAILMAVCIVVLILLVLIVPLFRNDYRIFIYGIGIFIGIGGIPIWFFQGMEKMKYLTIINFTARMIALVFILIFVRSPEDYRLPILFQSGGFLLGATFSIIIALKMFDLRFVKPAKENIIKQFKDGWLLFLSTLGINFYRESNAIILGFLTNYTYVGYYAAAEKIIKAIQSLVNPFVNALFPFFGRKLNLKEEIRKSLRQFYKVGMAYTVLVFILTVGVFLLAPWVIKTFLGGDYINSILDVQIMSFVILFGGMNYFFGIIGLANLGYDKAFTRAVWISGMVSIIVCLALAGYLLDNAAAIAIVVAELLLFIQIGSEFIKFNKENAITIR